MSLVSGPQTEKADQARRPAVLAASQDDRALIFEGNSISRPLERAHRILADMMKRRPEQGGAAEKKPANDASVESGNEQPLPAATRVRPVLKMGSRPCSGGPPKAVG